MGDLNMDLSGVKDEDMRKGEGTGSWTCKPDGWYRVMIAEANVKSNSAGTGYVGHFQLNHLDPQYAGKYEMDYINLTHPKAKVQEIGQAQLKELAFAVGHPNPDYVDDTSELKGKPFMVRLWAKSEPGSQYADTNGQTQQIGGHLSVSEWMDKEQGDSGPGAAPAAPMGGPSSSGPGGPPPPSGDDIPF